MTNHLMIRWACFALPGLIACALGFLSAFQLLHQRSGNGFKAFLSLSGLIYLGIRLLLAFAAYYAGHEYLISADEGHPEVLETITLDAWFYFLNLPVKHFIFALLAGLSSEFLLRGVIHVYTSSVGEEHEKREVMLGLQQLIKSLENHACTKAAIRDAHRKNKLVDRFTPVCPFPEFLDGVERSLGSYDAEVVKKGVRALRKEMNNLREKYQNGGGQNDRLYNQLLATQILNTFSKKTLKYFFKKLKKEQNPGNQPARRSTGT